MSVINIINSLKPQRPMLSNWCAIFIKVKSYLDFVFDGFYLSYPRISIKKEGTLLYTIIHTSNKHNKHIYTKGAITSPFSHVFHSPKVKANS